MITINALLMNGHETVSPEQAATDADSAVSYNCFKCM